MRLFAVSAAVLAAALLAGCSSAPSTPPPSTYLMGEKVQLGRLSYTVFETQWLTHLGDGPTPRVPENRFYLIRFAAVNGGSDDIAVPNADVIDDKGNTYHELSNGEGVPQWAGYLRTAKPADSLQGHLLFDAPPGHYKLKLFDETHTRFAYVDVPLSFGNETPEFPSPEKNE